MSLSHTGMGNQKVLKYSLVAPTVIILFLTTVLPLVYMLYTSFFRLDPIVFNKDWPFVGFKNYIYLLTQDPMFWSSLFRTVLFLIYTITPQIIVGLILATLLYKEFKGKRIVQTILLFPILATPIIIAMIWKYFFDFDTGFLNVFLRSIGAEPRPWLSTSGLPFVENIPVIGHWLAEKLYLTYAFRTIAFVNFWQWTPFCFLIFYSGMTSLPTEVYEAANMDGASAWQTFKYITFPLLTKVIGAVAFLRIIDCLKVYAQIWVLFGNAEATRVINIHLYTLGFTTSDYGKTSALGILLIIMITALVLLATRKGEKNGN